VDDQRRDRNALYYVRGCRASIVIVGTGKSAVIGGDPVIELAEASYPAQAGQVEEAGEMPGLPAHAAEKLQEKVVFVDAVRRLVQRISGGGQVHCRTNRRHCLQLRRCLASPLARKFQHQVAAHGESNQREAGDAIFLEDVTRHRGDIRRQAGIVECGRALIHAAAVALVHEYDVHVRRQRISRNTRHVLGFGGAFEAVHDDQRECLLSILRLPVAPAADLNARSDFDQSFFRRG